VRKEKAEEFLTQHPELAEGKGEGEGGNQDLGRERWYVDMSRLVRYVGELVEWARFEQIVRVLT